MISLKKIIIVGFGGHGKSIADIIKRTGNYEIVGYTDITEQNSTYKYLGTDSVLDEYYNRGIKYIAVGIGYLGKGNIREVIYKKIKDIGFELPVIADPSAIVSGDVIIEEGTIIGKGAIINTEARIGKMCIINTRAIIEHECTVGDFCHISVDSVLCGQVEVKDRAFVGANSVVIQCKQVKEGQIVPAGSTVR